jgi:hypothetical protein
VTDKALEALAIPVADQILDLRGLTVLLDADPARLYGAETRALNQAFKRNAARFPPDFAFQLTLDEAEAIRRSRSQSVTLKRGGNVKYRPWAFTEHGAIMAATVLNSPRAVEMSLFVARAFVRLRDLPRTHADLAKHLTALRQLIEPAKWLNLPIGFETTTGR